MFKRYLLTWLLCGLHSIYTQTQFSFPIDDSTSITGNYGEIRHKHFHQGIDFSTNGKENNPVKCIDDGYVYRIKISSSGYGKVLYIHHPSGLLSVYAHLNQFADKIQIPVNQFQLRNQINEFDILLPKDSIQIKKNEIIAYSGNTGNSTGPHLHFEIRDELTEIPLNPLFYFRINDTTKPVLKGVIFYDLSDSIHPKPIFQKTRDTMIVPSISGVAFSGYDQIYSEGNPNNIYKVSIYLDEQKIYQHRLHHITFDNTIYVEYFSEKIRNQIFQKCFAPHLYPSNFYDTLVNKGRIILSDTNYHTLKIILCDESNNCITKSICIQAKHLSHYKRQSIQKLISCINPNHIKQSHFELFISEKSLFQDIILNMKYHPDKNKIEYIGKPLSLKYPATFTLKQHIPQTFINRTLLVSSSKCYLPESVTSRSISFQIKELNEYRLYIDTQFPIIQPLQYHKKKNKIIILPTQQYLYFKLKDDTSIKEYKAYFNQQFCMAYYYASQKLLVVTLPQEYIAADNYEITIIASDIVGNTTKKSFDVLIE